MTSGLLIINKPKGITSHDVVAQVRKITGQRRVGHTGTLDPMATGVLVLCLGQTTRLIEYAMASRKQYRAVVRFGVTTDTLDAEGNELARCDASALTAAQLQALLPAFTGQIEQRPPAFSAIKQDGQPLYKRARAGQLEEPPPRPVTIYQLDWLNWQPPDLTVAVACSTGTYIRSLARDLGAAAGTGAHLVGLERTANGNWTLAQAVSLAELWEQPDAWRSRLLPPDEAVAHLPRLTLSAEESIHVKHGRTLALPNAPQNHGLLRVYAPDHTFLAILTRDDTADLWHPNKVFQT